MKLKNSIRLFEELEGKFIEIDTLVEEFRNSIIGNVIVYDGIEMVICGFDSDDWTFRLEPLYDDYTYERWFDATDVYLILKDGVNK